MCIRDSVLKALGPYAQFSYGYEILDGSVDPRELKQYPGATRILKKVDVFEVSPVLRGAGGPGATHLDEIKRDPELEAIRDRIEILKIRDDFLASVERERQRGIADGSILRIADLLYLGWR